MPMAFILINTEMGSETEVLEALQKMVNVKEAFVVYGVYDLVARVEADTMDQLKDIVTWKIRRLERVRSTLTMMAVQSQ
ncbi:Lrp/AsnC ligand binding domain-containing protein [Candidatus Bathyarchaeota archaeon]|nr:Lrp/AsnC ligand binding domain-containing protein [Candidatus Bathyarchaeota archaeon]